MRSTKIAVWMLSGLSLVGIAACNDSTGVAQASESSGERKRPREVCTTETVVTEKPAKDKDRVLGTVAGALVGGVVGDKLGGDVATVGGAVAGGYAGNRVQKSTQKKGTTETTRRVCRTVYD
ncbi:MAG: glycine zipper 2TM domain-containing protein [Steroidobacteraceae bacterium]